jgi:hypothetical protein
MRSVADALDALASTGWLNSDSCLHVRIVSLNLAGGDAMHFALVCVYPHVPDLAATPKRTRD